MHSDAPTILDEDESLTRAKIKVEPRLAASHRRLGQLTLVIVEGPDRGKQHSTPAPSSAFSAPARLAPMRCPLDLTYNYR